MSTGRDIAAATGPIGFAIAQVAYAHRMELVSRLRGLGLHPGQELIVVDLHENPDSSQSELVARLGVDQSTVAKALTRMERTGMVTRARSDADARIVRTRLTVQGEGLVKEIRSVWADLDRLAIGHLEQSEAADLLDLLIKVRTAIEGK
jgi:DNA-binding MarR family transcriptional regulator